jgi:hypothetical protein
VQVSLTSIRRSAILIGVFRKTEARRIAYFAKFSKDWQQKFVESREAVTEVVFDDMESSIHTKQKPLSIPVAVEKLSRLILSCDVVSRCTSKKIENLHAPTLSLFTNN